MREVENMDLVLIPAYEPDEQLITLTRRLKEAGLQVLVVNDGSGPTYQNIFRQVQANATVIELEKNSGKGAALKAGMTYIQDKLPQCEHFMTCDADGQHRVEDVLRVQEQLHRGDKFVLTVRRFQKDMPLRSKIGNSLSRFVYALLSNRYLSDNQSGLRGFHRDHISWLVKVEKDNYDYEMNMLYYAAKKNIPIATVSIEAIYIDNNESSHFNPVLDTLRIYKSLFSLAMGSVIAFGVVEMLMLILSVTFGYHRLVIFMPTVAACGYLTEYLLNRFVYFKGTPCHDYFSKLIYTVILYIFYTLGCMLTMYTLPGMPLFAAFNIVYLICIPLRYLLYKFTFIAGKPRE